MDIEQNADPDRTTVRTPMPEALVTVSLSVGGSTLSFPCRRDTHLLAALLGAQRKEVPSGCHGGGCGVCKVRIINGDYHCLPMSRQQVSPQELAEGYSLACRTFATSSVSIEVVGSLNKALKSKYGLF